MSLNNPRLYFSNRQRFYTVYFFLVWFCLCAQFAWADGDPSNPYIDKVEIIQTERQDSAGHIEKSTIVKVKLRSVDGFLKDYISHIEMREKNGVVYYFDHNDFFSTKSGDFYLKKFSEFLDGEINFIIHDFKGYSYDFPNQPNTAKINNLYLYDGTWEGTTNQGYDISFVVINNIVETLSIKMRIVGSLCNVQWTTEGSRDITIVNNSYSWHVEITDVFIENFTGTFASNLKCDGTWNFTDFDCNGYASGSWKATNLTPATTTTTTTTTTTSTTTNPTSTTTTTLPISPQVITGSSKVITSNTTILNGKVNPNGSNTEAYFEYGSTTNYEYSTETQLLGSGSALLTVSATIPDLVAETLYHYRLVASNSAGNSQGADETFYTFISYVSPDAMCGGNIPCYATVQSAVDASETEGVIKILQGAFDENIVTNQSYNLTLSGGWDSTFTTQASDTLINSLTIKGSAETVEIDNITIQ